MANMWDEFDKVIDTAGLAEDVKKAEENGGQSRVEVPRGTYEISVQKLELTKSRKGDPMVTCWMRIVDGQYKGSLIFMNQVVTRDFQLANVNKFVRDLLREANVAIDIHFSSYRQYGGMLMDVMEAIDNNFEYLLDYQQNSKGYDTFEIKDVYELEN